MVRVTSSLEVGRRELFNSMVYGCCSKPKVVAFRTIRDADNVRTSLITSMPCTLTLSKCRVYPGSFFSEICVHFRLVPLLTL